MRSDLYKAVGAYSSPTAAAKILRVLLSTVLLISGSSCSRSFDVHVGQVRGDEFLEFIASHEADVEALRAITSHMARTAATSAGDGEGLDCT